MKHVTVLKTEAVDSLALTPAATVLDCTFGGGGHSNAILEQLGAGGHLLSIDADEQAISDFVRTASSPAKHSLQTANFKDILAVSAQLQLSSYQAIMADLGWRSEQFTEGKKGFSFLHDEPLLMTYGNPDDYLFTAHDVVNTWAEESIADVIYGYGEERAARRIAKAIVEKRQDTPIATSAQLAALIEDSIGKFYRRSRIHPATKTFQALRIVVNDELGALERLLDDGFSLLAPEGRMAIITFHSIEDRLVKRFFRTKAREQRATLVHKKPISPSSEEINDNPRARSAKLRTLKKSNV